MQNSPSSEDINTKVQAARQLLMQGNIQECANRLNEIIYREDAAEEEKESYRKIMEAMQQQNTAQQQLYMSMYPGGSPGTEEMQQ